MPAQGNRPPLPTGSELCFTSVPENLRIPGEIALRQRRHHAPRVGHRDVHPRGPADPQVFVHPAVLDEPRRRRPDNHVHAEAALVDQALRPTGTQLLERRRGQHRYRKEVEERPHRHRRRHTGVGKERRSDLCLDHRVAMPGGVGALDVGMILIDREILGGSSSEGDLAAEVRGQDAVSLARVAHHRRAVGQHDAYLAASPGPRAAPRRSAPDSPICPGRA